jgi:HEAT repeat protein
VPRTVPRLPATPLICLLVLAVPAGADVIRLRGGARLVGRVVSETEAAVTIVADGGQVTVARSRVEGIERGPLPEPDPAPASDAAETVSRGAAKPEDAAKPDGVTKPDGGAKTAPVVAKPPTPAAKPPAPASPPPDPAKLKRAVSGMMEKVGTPGGPTRESLATHLAAMGPDAVPVLVAMLPRLDTIDRLLPAVTAAVASPTPELMAALTKMTTDDVPERRHVAAFGLGQAGTAADIPRLGRMLLDEVGFVRYSAREALVNIRARNPGPETTRAALKALDGSRDEVRREILALLGQLDDPAGYVAVEEAADRAEGDDRPAAWRALAMMSDPRAVDFFRRRLGAGTAQERRLAVDALACHRGATAVVPLLIGRLDDEAPAVRAASAQHLVRIAGEDHGPDAAGWSAWWEQERRAVEERERIRKK